MRETITKRIDEYLASNDARVEWVRDAVRMALCQGAKIYSELASLVPSRPSHAADCKDCSGTGAIAHAPELICSCGGVGWVIPGEGQAPSPG